MERRGGQLTDCVAEWAGEMRKKKNLQRRGKIILRCGRVFSNEKKGVLSCKKGVFRNKKGKNSDWVGAKDGKEGKPKGRQNGLEGKNKKPMTKKNKNEIATKSWGGRFRCFAGRKKTGRWGSGGKRGESRSKKNLKTL